ncbi:MAG: imidazole glycerol phosphate synthase, glutamine amidotransferase subunit [Candidatus Firestonebacteria bacterium RIFOXYA2_FULL_40_8]|nr:MAG: imidazole glycerol phosphate synthase, glutamine amidotransferase subunit [Candidatus Firestonebacteria bacterium RIFOXYA2_FULL_40_8]
MGNLMSVSKALASVYPDVRVTSSKSVINSADAVVLPGVGAFEDAVKHLNKKGISRIIKSNIDSGKPFLGICLGLQLLFTRSEENGTFEGFDVIKGTVKKFPAKIKLKVPQIGWNKIFIKQKSPMLKGIKDGSFVYFVHSYYGVPEDKSIISTETVYGVKFASSVCFDNVFASQFHPEKSQRVGLKILENFVELTKCS